MLNDQTSNSLVNTQGDGTPFGEEILSLVNKAIDAAHNLKHLNSARIENAISNAKEKNKKLLVKVLILDPPYDLSFHYGLLILMGAFTKAPVTGIALTIHSSMPDRETSATKVVTALSILGREISHPTSEQGGLGFQIILPTVAKKILIKRYKISENYPKPTDYASLREKSEEKQAATQTEDNPALVKKGETLASVIKNILSKENKLTNYSDVEYAEFISVAIDHILQDQKRYNVTGATRQELLAGTSIDRDEIAKLLTSLEEKVTGGVLAANAQKTNPEPAKEATDPVYSAPQDDSVSNVVASWRDNIHQDFLTEGFRSVVKKVCNINDTINLEAVFIKYCDKTVAVLTESLKGESPDIQKEVLSFLTWVRKSYLSSQKPDVFEKLPFYSVIEAVARGVNGTAVNTNANVKVVFK